MMLTLLLVEELLHVSSVELQLLRVPNSEMLHDAPESAVIVHRECRQ